MSAVYKRIINEYKNLNNKIIENPNNYKYNNFIYKIITIENGDVLFKSEINITYKNKKHDITIFYKKNYPFSPPSKILLNNSNIFQVYRNIMDNNKDIINNCLCCESLLCSSKWNVINILEDILKEIIKVIDYKQLYIKRQLLNLITVQFTNQNLDYLHSYLL